MEYIIGAILLVIFILIIANFKIVPQAQVYVVERLGAFNRELHTGPHMIIPVIDKIAKKVTIKEQVARLQASAGYHQG